MDMTAKIHAAADYIRSCTPILPKVGLILGLL